MNLAKIWSLRVAANREDPLPHKSYAKEKMWRSPKWLRLVAFLDHCVICGNEKRAVPAAHRNEGKGMGIKAHDCWSASLCLTCHADIDQGKELTQEQRRQVMNDAILDTLVLLVESGKVVVK